jgi:hypothetical protein
MILFDAKNFLAALKLLEKEEAHFTEKRRWKEEVGWRHFCLFLAGDLKKQIVADGWRAFGSAASGGSGEFCLAAVANQFGRFFFLFFFYLFFFFFFLLFRQTICFVFVSVVEG